MKTFHKIETKVLKFIILFGHVLETVLAILIMIGLIISLKPLVLAMGELGSGMEEVLPHFLEAAFNLVIGIEFVDMLTKHSPGSALEVLLYAIVRHMVLEGGTTKDMIIGTGAILVIFIIRKYFFVKSFEEDFDGILGDSHEPGSDILKDAGKAAARIRKSRKSHEGRPRRRRPERTEAPEEDIPVEGFEYVTDDVEEEVLADE
ncbi:MAG: transporter [Lachnospiraceae bacterium]|nr:transporter [Lachnospiraceae bacterium]